MNPNSGNQRWSRWAFSIHPGGSRRPSFDLIKTNAARFGRKAFGSSSQMKVEVSGTGRVVILVRSEGHPVHEEAYVRWMEAQWRRWALEGWGPETTLVCATKFEAGSRQDGTPPDQLIIAPSIRFLPEEHHE